MALEIKQDGMILRVRANDLESMRDLFKGLASSLEDRFQAALERAIQRKDVAGQMRAETVLRYLKHADNEGLEAIQATIQMVSSEDQAVIEKWNPHAKSGRRSATGGERGRGNRRSNLDLWQEEADQLRIRNPRLSKAKLGEIIAKKHGGAPGYIRKVIK